MCSHLERQLNVEPTALLDPQDSAGPRSERLPLPVPSSGLFTHPKPTINAHSTAVPSFGPSAPPSPPSTGSAIPSERSSRRSSADPYPGPTDNTHLPTPLLHSDASSVSNSMSPLTQPDPTSHDAKIVSSAGSNTMQIPDDIFSPPYHHVHSRKFSSPATTRPKGQHSQGVCVRSTAHVARSVLPVYHYSIHRTSPPLDRLDRILTTWRRRYNPSIFLGPCPEHLPLPAPPTDLFVHPKPSPNYLPTILQTRHIPISTIEKLSLRILLASCRLLFAPPSKYCRTWGV